MTEVAICPSCRRPVPRHEGLQPPAFPFCSKRCQQVDLGRWFQGDFVIPGPISPDDVDAIAKVLEARRGET